MKTQKRWCAGLLIVAASFFAGGCYDAVRDGLTQGVTEGIASLIESMLTAAANTALDGTGP